MRLRSSTGIVRKVVVELERSRVSVAKVYRRDKMQY